MNTFGCRLAINPIGIVGDGYVVADFEASHLWADRDDLARTISSGDGRWIARDRVSAPGNHEVAIIEGYRAHAHLDLARCGV